MLNVFQRAAVWFAQRALKFAAIPLRDPSVSTLFGYMDTASGSSVTEWTAMNYSAFWAANKIFGEAVASLPVNLYRHTKDGKKLVEDHPAVPLVQVAPNDEQTPYTFFETVQVHTTSWGNGFGEIERNGAGDPIAIWPLTPNRVTPDRKKSGGIYYRIYNPNGETSNCPAEDMIHIPGLGFDGIMGYSIINMARDCIGLGLATERFGGTFFGNGAHPSGILTFPNKLQEQAKKNVAESWFNSHGGPDRSNKVAVIDNDGKYQPISIPPEDAQFLQTRQFNVLEIARWFNLPPHMLRDLEGANNNTLEQQAIEFVTYSLRPWLLRWQQELRRKLLKPNERKRLFFCHDLEPLLVGDVLTRFKAYALGRQWGWLSANDVRKKENENPIPNGDVYLEPVNMIEAGQQDKNQDPDATPPEPGRAPATPKHNPTQPNQPLVMRGTKSKRSKREALDLLAAQPGSTKDGHIPVPFPAVDKTPDAVKNADLSGAEKKTLPIASLVALRAEMKRDAVRVHIEDPSLKGNPEDVDGRDNDRPYVVEHQGVRYLYDGTHRTSARMFLGATKIKAYLVKV